MTMTKGLYSPPLMSKLSSGFPLQLFLCQTWFLVSPSPKILENAQQVEEPSSPFRSVRNGNFEALAMKTPLLLVILLALLVTIAADSVVEELEKNGLPGGLLPSSVKSYSIGKDGDFRVTLEAPCYTHIEDQLVYYSPNITGTLKFGSIGNLDGIETKQLFVWLSVTGIYVDVPASPYIYFEVGVLTKRLALAAFETPPKCNPGSHAIEAGLHISSSAVDGEFGGSRPREALQ